MTDEANTPENIAALRQGMLAAMATAHAAYELASAVALQSPDKKQLLVYFNTVAERIDADLLYSTASEDGLALLEQARSGI